MKLVYAVLGLVLSAGVTFAEKGATLDLRSIELRHANPSMGPFERKTSFSLQAGAFPAEVRKLLTETKVNGKATLADYLAALKAHDAARLKSVRDAYKPAQLSEGATISDLVFVLGDDTILELHDLRTFRLDGYYATTFQSLLVQKGNASVTEPVNVGPASKPVRPMTDEERAARRTHTPSDLPPDPPAEK